MSHADAARQIWKRRSTAAPHARRAQKMTQGSQISAGQLQKRVPEIFKFCALLDGCAPPLNNARHWPPRAVMARMLGLMDDNPAVILIGPATNVGPLHLSLCCSVTLQRLSWV